MSGTRSKALSKKGERLLIGIILSIILASATYMAAGHPLPSL
jgi:hypothetical protein